MALKATLLREWNDATHKQLYKCEPGGALPEWCELPGSFKGTQDHGRAIRDAGYEVVP